MTALDPDIAPVGDALAAAFTLPDYLPPEYHALYHEVLTRLRNEARGISMTTAQTLIMERISYFYVVMKYKEASGELGLKEQKETLDFWLKTTIEFNRMLTASENKSNTTFLVELQNILRNSLKVLDGVDLTKVSATELKQRLNVNWNEEFARINA